jgi:glycosyltransferase involved in cell wall biosynthesis
MTPLSAVIITYNEEANIARCIRSLKGISEQVLVVDSFSSDRTVEIAEAEGAEVQQHPFEGHIQQKNHAMKQARYDRVLSLDADEELSPEAAEAIGKAKAAFDKDAYSFPRMTEYCGQWIRHCGWYPDRKVRLWDRRKGRWGGMNPHDRVVMEQGARIGKLEGDLLHHSFPSIRSHVETANTFSDIVADELYSKGEKPRILFHLILNPSFTFFRKYFLQGGFKDGYYGFLICVISSYYNFLKYAKGRQRFTKGSPQPSRAQTR